MDLPEIRSPQYRHNMAGWCVEKSTNALRALTSALDTTRASRTLGVGEKEQLDFELSDAIWDVTKLLAFACGRSWSTTDAEAVIDRSTGGLEELLVRYGLLDETTEGKQHRKAQELVARIRACLHEPRHVGRSQIHEILARYHLDAPPYKVLADLTEQVTMGELGWEEYIPQAESALQAIESGH